eukprot:gnl/MRDRNA2_/MRDRNA2_32842_c0_seq1.p1 gnl/MRDRNA2_/MRDRNA2_32842_c0~~gnl/MRDRNA2_/MRDRNA2_32842_c0_seq1.p1  ORF type:complete len:206 (-),score=16.20 gnl/MRDRNA2_/MRDRNA2_32842_c0_seq1:237-854(-)
MGTLKALLLAWSGGGPHPWNWTRIACEAWWPDTSQLYASEVDCSLWPTGRAFHANVDPIYALQGKTARECHLQDLAGGNLLRYNAELIEVDIVAGSDGTVLYPLIREHYTSQQGCAAGKETISSSTRLRGYYTFNDENQIVAYESEYWSSPKCTAAPAGALLSETREPHVWQPFLGGLLVGCLPCLYVMAITKRLNSSGLNHALL